MTPTDAGHWKIAGVQMDCRLGDGPANLERIRRGLVEAAQRGARLIVFPECALTGYCFRSKEEALPHAQPLPGPASETLAADCARLGVFAAVGLLERGVGGELFNSCVLVGRTGYIASYRKVHRPCMGVDRFITLGDRPFAVHDLGGLRVGMNICYDGSFPEASRALTLLGADLIVLPTNWPRGSEAVVKLTEARALENHIYYVAVNRIGEERGTTFIGRSRIVDYNSDVLAEAKGEGEEIVLAEIDPAAARRKRVVRIPGEREVDRVGDRRPEMYALVCQRQGVISPGGPPPS
jgi:predicted amidohydrolase